MSDPRHWSIPTNSLLNHKKYTSVEWNDLAYFDAVVEYLKENNIKSFVDVGGCTGEVSNILLERIDSIDYGLIFEPHPDNYEFILKAVDTDKVQVENKALFYGEDSISLSIRHPNVGSWSIVFSESHPEYSVDVPCVDIDTYLSEREYDFVKIDIEGSEFNLIENSKLLKDVKYIELEVHHEHFRIQQKSNSKYEKYEYCLDFIKEHLPNHEIEYYLGDEPDPGNMLLIKK